MKTFTLAPGGNIAAYSNATAAALSGNPTFRTPEELAGIVGAPRINLTDVWNGLPGVRPVKKFMNRQTGLDRIWKRVQSLEPLATPKRTKQQLVLDLMKRPEGATLGEIMQATDWQRHTVRGFVSATAGKKLGLRIESFLNQCGERTYRVSD